jgi:lysophospholipid acyltransferase (LPLAT)-like uncharacterized protein
LKIEGRLGRVLVALFFPLLRLWFRSLRYEVEDRCQVRTRPKSQPLIGALWHNRLLLIPYVAARFLANRDGAALISASRDGSLIADVVERFGFLPVRGSSSRRGSAALLELADVVAAGRDPLITPDGPRGPVYEVSAGIVFLAQKTGAPIMPINFEYSSYWRVKSWDRFILPKPFSKVRVVFAELHPVKPTSTEEEFEQERRRLQAVLMSLVEMR